MRRLLANPMRHCTGESAAQRRTWVAPRFSGPLAPLQKVEQSPARKACRSTLSFDGVLSAGLGLGPPRATPPRPVLVALPALGALASASGERHLLCFRKL